MSDSPATPEAWLLAGQELLRAGGVRSVKLTALTRALGRTTGSFYHHFGSMTQYLEALADFYGTEQVETMLGALAPLEPQLRLVELARISRDHRMQPLSLAMREWGASDRRAAAAVQAADGRLLEFVCDTLIELGYEEPDAQVRAQLLFAVGASRVVTPWRPPGDLDRRILSIIAAP
ncbi:MAG: TetR/AcrR family transcriptional regulator [Actinobacteria bacterium]|nr:TetR/AcrR family transcriptional regulator [Actinomycetota bacterium]